MEEFETFETDLLRLVKDGCCGGDVDSGELGNGGDTLLLLDIGGLDDQNLGKFSLAQAGMLLVFFFFLLWGSLELKILFVCL